MPESPERSGFFDGNRLGILSSLAPPETSSPMKTLTLTLALVGMMVLAGCATNSPPSQSTPSATTPTASTAASSTPVSSTPATMTPATPALHADLLGDGSTFVAPLMDKWRTAFHDQNSGVTISYTGGGSGKGRGDITKNLVDFAGSDAPMSDAELANATDVIELPAAAGAVTIAYNVPELGSTPLKLDGDAIAKMFMGNITKWNDPALQALNPGVSLPAQDISIVHRSDGSGTTSTFTDYLVKVSPAWAAAIGKGSTVNWPVGTGAAGNNGVGSQVQQLPYSVGYLGAEWANISKVQTALIKNSAGNFEGPTADAVAKAVAAGAFDAKLRGSVTNQGCDGCYPISLVSWLLVHQHQADAAKGKAVAAFLWYAVHEGQQLNAGLNYVPIPASVVQKEETFINAMDANGQPLR